MFQFALNNIQEKVEGRINLNNILLNYFKKLQSKKMNYTKSEKIIEKCYCEMLKRKPDKEGLKYFSDLLQKNKLTEEGLIKKISKSDEYVRMMEADKQSKKNEVYIFKGFQNILYEIHPNSSIDYEIAKNHIYDRYVGNQIKNYINQNGVILDVGANVGGLTLPFAKILAPLGKVYAFEPDLQIIDQLKKNIEINDLKNVTIVPMALQENQDIQEIEFIQRRKNDEDGRINKGLSTIQKIDNDYKKSFKLKKQIVKCTTIDYFVKKEKIERLDLIKLDVEGAEYRVLKGGIKTIQKNLPIIVYESSSIHDKVFNFSNSEKTFQLIKNEGYQQFKIMNTEKLEKMDNYSKESLMDIICFHKTKIPKSIKY